MGRLFVTLGSLAVRAWIFTLQVVGAFVKLVGIRLFSLDPATLVGDVEQKCGRKLSIATNPVWMDGLRLVASRTNTECDESQLSGRWLRENYVKWSIVKPLIAAECALARHPQISDVSISRPVFITGAGRNGSTLLQDLMCCYRGVRYLRIPECMDPAPLDGSRDLDPIWRQERQKFWKDYVSINEGGVMDLSGHSHRLTDSSPEECVLLLSKYLFWFPLVTFGGNCDGVEWSLSQPDFTHHAYRMYKRELQLLLYFDQMIDGVDTDSVKLVLKCPLHTVYHNIIRKVFPDALIVRLHRDPVDMTTSFCAMFETLRKVYSTKTSHDPLHLGEAKLKWVSLTCNRMVEEGVVDGTIDVRYLDLKKDPVGTCAMIAEAAGLEHNEIVEQKIVSCLEERFRQRDSVHRPDPAYYGLNPTAIRQDLHEYCNMFKV